MDIENRLVVAEGAGAEGGLEWGVGISRCMLLCGEWIHNKVLLLAHRTVIHVLC